MYDSSVVDPTVAPAGKHVMNIFSQYGPYALKGGLNWETEREAYADRCIDLLAEYAPNIKSAIMHREILTPVDLEREFHLTGGNIFHGRMTLEQMFSMRPVPGFATTARRTRAVHVRERNPSRRRGDGHAGTQRGERDTERLESLAGPRLSTHRGIGNCGWLGSVYASHWFQRRLFVVPVLKNPVIESGGHESERYRFRAPVFPEPAVNACAGAMNVPWPSVFPSV